MADIGEQVMGIVSPFIVLIILISLAVGLSPTAVQYIHQLGQQMLVNGTSTLTKTLGSIMNDYGEVIWYGGIFGAIFGDIYVITKKFREL